MSVEYDFKGNLLIAHQQLANMALDWDFKEQLSHVNIANGQDVYFTYDASGQRVRKVWVHNGITEERIYLGGFEVYRRHENGGVVLERQTLHVMDGAQRVAMVETKTVDVDVPNLTPLPRIRFQCSNHLGSSKLELDALENPHPRWRPPGKRVNVCGPNILILFGKLGQPTHMGRAGLQSPT